MIRIPKILTYLEDIYLRLISALAVELANKNPAKVDGARRAELKAMYEQEWQYAKDEDRERASFYIRPKIRGY
jgi:hypothetical protein